MRRCWFGLALMLALLAAGLAVTWGMNHWHDPVAADLERASDAALWEDWQKAEHLLERAEGRWKKHWRFSATFADHEPMEEIDAVFAQLGVYLDARDQVSLAAGCASLARQVEAIGDAHGLNWWNLL